MPKRKSGEQPKQAAGGGASRSSKPQAANIHRSANASHPQKTGNSHAKPPTSPGTGAAPRPPQAHRPANATKSQSPSNGAPKPQGTNGPFNFTARLGGKPPSPDGVSQGQSMNEGGAKRNGNGHNHHQKAQGHGPLPNGSSKQQAPKPPKISQPLFGAPSPSLFSPAPPHPGNVQHAHIPKAHGASITGNKVFQDPSPTSKQGGQTHPHVQKTQNHVPTPPKASHQQQSAGKNAASNIFTKIQVAETHHAQAQHSSREPGVLGQPSALAKGPQAGNPSHKSQQQHKAPSHSLLVHETFNQSHKNTATPLKPPTNDKRQTQAPTTQSTFPNFFSFFSSGSASGDPQNPPHKSHQPKAPTHSRPEQEISNKGHKAPPPKPQMNDRRQGHLPTESVLPTPKESQPILSTGSKYHKNPLNKSQAAPTHLESRPLQEVLSSKGHKDSPPKPQTNDRRQGQPPTELFGVPMFSLGSEDPKNPPQKSQQHKVMAATHSRPEHEASNKVHKDTPPKAPMKDRRQGQLPIERLLPPATPKESPPPILTTGSKGPENPSHKPQQHKASSHSHLPQEVLSNKGHKKDGPPKAQTNDRHQGQPPTESLLPKIFPIFSLGSEGPQNPLHKSQKHKAATHSLPEQEVSNKGHKDTSPKPPMKDKRKGQLPTESVLPTQKDSPPILSAGSKDHGNPSNKSQQHKVAPPTHSESRPVQEVLSNKGHIDSLPKPQTNDRRKQQLPTESVPLKVSFSPESKDVSVNGIRSSNFVIPPESGSESLHSRSVKKKGKNLNQGTASVPQAAAAPRGWGQILSSWIFPSVPSIDSDKPPQTTSQPVSSSKKAKDAQAGPKPQSPKSNKDGSSKSHPSPNANFVLPEPLKKQPMPPTKGTNNGLHDLQNRSKELNTLFSTTLPKKGKEPTPDSMLTRNDAAPGGSSSVFKKPEMVIGTNLSFALSHTMDRPQVPSKPQEVQGSSTVKPKKSTVHRKKVPVHSSSSRAQILFQDRKRTAARKDLLRQRGPTMIWREGDTPRAVSAYSTLTAAPVPSPPKNELQNEAARKTISENPDLFKIVTPINADALKRNLKDHPNQPFVKSVVRGIKRGFWPFADTTDLPTTHDGSGHRSTTISKEKAKFIQQQSQDEMNLGRWSKPFEKLLPGMHASPISAVPKSTPGKHRLVNDQSRGPHALNSKIEKNQVKVKLDTIHDLGDQLLAVRKKHPKRKIRLWKSDVKSAYRQLPVHPLWQIKQAIPVDGQYHIDRCNTFGNRGAGWNWDRFISLVNWIGTEKKGVSGLLGYVDDNFGWEYEGKESYYEPYKKKLPTKQARLLRLWDELGIPHDEEKQLSGPSLRILGYDVDANKMTVKVPDEKKEKVVKLLRSHAEEGKPYTVNELQIAAGSVNSSLSLYPRIRPGLRVLFDEMAKQEPGTSKLEVTKDVARTLSELANFLEDAPPVRIKQQKKSVHGTSG